ADLTAPLPPQPFRIESRLLARLVRGNIGGVLLEKPAVVFEPEYFITHVQMRAPVQKVVPKLQQFIAADGIEANLVKEAQQPWLFRRKFLRDMVGVPHLAGTADELVAARSFHAVHA